VTGRSVVRWLPAVAQAALIFLLSAQPDLHLAETPLLDFLLHKLGHLAVYGVLAGLVAWAMEAPGRQGPRGRPRGAAGWWYVPLLLCIAYGASDELHQAFVHGRGPSPVDVLIDGLGALLGLAAYSWLGRRRGSGRPV
jgi:VanZ family protein